MATETQKAPGSKELLITSKISSKLIWGPLTPKTIQNAGGPLPSTWKTKVEFKQLDMPCPLSPESRAYQMTCT